MAVVAWWGGAHRVVCAAMTETPIRTRFAPSPTGRLHLGNLRVALFNWLLARASGGEFLLRIEDTDRERGSEAAMHDLLEDLRWLGLAWDHGPGEAESSEWRQSARDDVYRQYYDVLTASGQAYPCFCSEQRLSALRKRQLAAGEPPRYDGACAGLTADEVRSRLAAGETAALRFAVPAEEDLQWTDLVRGEQHSDTRLLGDFVIRRADGTPAFLFCNALDDALAGVTHVLRGEDHLANTPRQLLLLEALSLPAPAYGHTGLLVGEDGAPLSKRHGHASVAELREAGYLPLAVANTLARLGHAMDDEGLLAMEALAGHFSPGRLGRGPARLDAGHLQHWQRLAAHTLAPEALLQWLAPVVSDRVPESELRAFLEAMQPNLVLPEDARFWADVIYGEDPAALPQALAAGAAFFRAVLAARAEHGNNAKAIATAVREATGASGRAFFQPLRLALTGTTEGPAVDTLLALLPEATVTRRLARCEQQAATVADRDH